MKALKNATLAALLLASAHHASAQTTTIRFAASNGDRTATQTAISKILDPGWTYHGTGGATSDTGSLSVATGANFGTWKGTFQGNPVTIKTNYAGALAGIAAVAGNTDQRFDTSDGSGTHPVYGTAGLPNPLNGTTLGTDYELGTVDFGFSTNFQSTSPFNGFYEGVTYSPIVEEIVGVSPLGFYASPGFPADNITTQLAQYLYSTGAVPLALFTGNWTEDQNKIVYAIGRNTDAGQRFGAYTEIGLGVNQTVTVWDPRTVAGGGGTQGATTSGNYVWGGTVVNHKLWPSETISNIFSPEGSGGFNSGATLAAALTVKLGADAYKGLYNDPDDGPTYLYPNATAGYYIGYLTPGDGNPRVLGVDENGNDLFPTRPADTRGVALKYNGVPLTSDNVRTGKYTAWLYNRILKPQSGLTGLRLTFANALRDQIANVDAPSGGGLFHDASFKVRRTTDGGIVRPR